MKYEATHIVSTRWIAAHSLVFRPVFLQAFLCAAMIFSSLLSPSGHAHAQETSPALYVNLQEFPLYLKHGFDPEDTVQPDVHDGSWIKKSPFSNIIISKLGLPGLPKRVFLSPFKGEEEEFTFVIPFTLHGINALALTVMPGLFLAGISDNWEIYLNGTLIRKEIHFDGSSLRILQHRSQRDVFFPLPSSLLREGSNLLAFRIVGDPTDQTVGFQYSTPFYIGDYKDIMQKNDQTLTMLLIGGYLLIAIYHLSLFIMRRKDTHNLYCGIFSALMGFYFLSRTHSIYNYVTDTAIVVKVEFFCIFLVIPALGAFAETLCSKKTSTITKLYSAFFAFLALSQLALPRPYGSDVLVVWQIMAIAALLYILIHSIILVFIREVKTERKQYALRGTQAPGLTHFFTETYAGNLLLAISIVVVSGIVDILDSLFFHHLLNLTRYCFYFFVMTVTLMLARTYGKLNNALHAKRIFLANVSHEIRTPLNAIMGTAEQIAREMPPKAVRGKIEHIQKAGGILTSIINDILDFSRLEAGKMEIVNREYRFRPLIDEVTSIVAMQLTGKDVAFSTRINPAVPETLVGDALRIRQILLNLLWNAVKFTERGSIEFSATLQEANKSPTLVFTISDTGRGIPRKDLNNIFTEFYQMDSRMHRSNEGAGLGLSICKNLCLLMRGEISVRSEYGNGSTFTVTLPLQPGTGHIAAEEARPATLLQQGIGFPGARVLVVDDLESNRQVLLGLLAPYGLELHVAANGREALQLAAAQAYDLIFMDHVMEEGLDGVTATKALRQLSGHRATPVVALTANAMRGMREFFLENDFQGYISKPIDSSLLDATLAAWLPEKKQMLRGENTTHVPLSPPLLGDGTENARLAHPSPEQGQGSNTPLRTSKGIAGTDSVQNPLPATDINAGAVKRELIHQRLNLLNHYRWHFASGLATDAAYIQKFGSLLDELTRPPHIPAALREEAAKLAKAGQRADTETIRQHLPPLYAALAKLFASGKGAPCAAVPRTQDENSLDTLNALLLRLQKALKSNATTSVDALMAQLQGLPPTTLEPETRELYFLLYDALMMDQTEKALGALALWSQTFGRKA